MAVVADPEALRAAQHRVTSCRLVEAEREVAPALHEEDGRLQPAGGRQRRSLGSEPGHLLAATRVRAFVAGDDLRGDLRRRQRSDRRSRRLGEPLRHQRGVQVGPGLCDLQRGPRHAGGQ